MGILRKIGSSIAKNYERAATKIIDTGVDAVKATAQVASDMASDIGESARNVGRTVKSSATKFNTVKNPIPPKPASTKGFVNKARNARDSFVNNVVLPHNTRQIGPVSISTRGGLMDEAIYHARAVQSLGIGAWDFATNGIGEKHYGQLLRRSNNSLLGYKTTKFGTTVAMGAAFVAGTPSAVKEYNTARQGQYAGVYQMGAIPGLVPQGHAYANNAGATGDLVLALNNNR